MERQEYLAIGRCDENLVLIKSLRKKFRRLFVFYRMKNCNPALKLNDPKSESMMRA